MRLLDNRSLSLQNSCSLDSPDIALVNYLDSLLHDIQDPADRPVTAVSKVDISLADIPEQKQSQLGLENQSASSQDDKVPVEKERHQQLSKKILPAWAATTFQILLFKVNGVLLGVPLTVLGGILKWSDKINAMPGMPTWILGMLLDRGHRILVMDTARILMPGRINNCPCDNCSRSGYVLLIQGTHWGLSVDELASTMLLQPYQVKWRDREDKRSWFAGVIVEQLSVLLDVDGLIGMLVQNNGLHPSTKPEGT